MFNDLQSINWIFLVILSHDDVVTLGVIAILTFFVIDQNNNVLKITGAQRYDVFKEVFDSLLEK